MLERHLEEYYKCRKSSAEISQELGFTTSTFYKKLRKNGYKTRKQYYAMIDTGIKELDERLKSKYNAIVNRCNGIGSHKGENAEGREYLTLIDYVEFCNSNKEKAKKIWNKYINSNRNDKLTISIDRIDDNKGYTKSNMRLVTYGFNSWSRNIRPIKIEHKNKEYYFMSAEEGSRYFEVRRQSIGDLLRGKYRKISKEFKVEESNIDKVLSKSQADNLEGYYNKYILNI